MSAVAEQHLAEMRRVLQMPPREARFWRESSEAERCYLLSQVEHPRHLIRETAAKGWAEMDASERAAAGRAYRHVIAWAEEAARRGEVVSL